MKEIEEAMLFLRQHKQGQKANFDFLEKADDAKSSSKMKIHSSKDITFRT